MFSHITVGTNDMDVAHRFYDALFAAMGARPGVFDEKGRLLYFKDGRMFGVTASIDGQPACHANGGTIGFSLGSAEAVRAWQEAGVAHGGTAIEDPPGVRNMSDHDITCTAHSLLPSGSRR